jgi:hypothetical protein
MLGGIFAVLQKPFAICGAVTCVSGAVQPDCACCMSKPHRNPTKAEAIQNVDRLYFSYHFITQVLTNICDYSRLQEAVGRFLTMCYRLVERYSVCRCLYHKHSVDMCSDANQAGHTVQERTLLVGDLCSQHSSRTDERRGKQ